jgi:hypothetical protein
VGLNPDRDFPSQEAIQLVYGTALALLKSVFASEIMHTGAPEVFLHQ